MWWLISIVCSLDTIAIMNMNAVGARAKAWGFHPPRRVYWRHLIGPRSDHAPPLWMSSWRPCRSSFWSTTVSCAARLRIIAIDGDCELYGTTRNTGESVATGLERRRTAARTG
jgi:hypothetical protein